MFEIRELQFKVKPNAPCIFCSNQPTTTSHVPVGIGKSIKQAPCCGECSRKYKKFKIYSLTIVVLSGQIISFLFGFLNPNVIGHPTENSGGFVILGIFVFILPVGLLFSLYSRLTYVKKIRKWLRTYSDYYS